MENYALQKDEVALYHGTVTILANGKQKTEKIKKAETEVYLTNLNVVFITKVKQVLSKAKSLVEVYGINTIKFYKDTPHIIKRGEIIELYFLDCEKFIAFTNNKEAKLFMDTALKLISGDSKFVRTVKKIKNEIEETNEKLDINIQQIAKKTVDVAIDVAMQASGLPDTKKGAKILGTIAGVLKNKKHNETKALCEKSESVET